MKLLFGLEILLVMAATAAADDANAGNDAYAGDDAYTQNDDAYSNANANTNTAATANDGNSWGSWFGDHEPTHQSWGAWFSSNSMNLRDRTY